MQVALPSGCLALRLPCPQLLCFNGMLQSIIVGHVVTQELPDPEGRPYYYNTQTGVSQWDKPADMP